MGLYIHVPFCATKCPYCDFNTFQGIENLMGPYLEALTTELELWGRLLAHPRVNTVFFGGGTPSYLPNGHIQKIQESIRSNFALSGDAEITVEANPDDLTPSKCDDLISQGANRLSIGVQSLDDGLLKLLGRRHDAAQAVQAVKTARSAGFLNVSMDLMYGLPDQSLGQWQDTLSRLVSLQPNHLSLYCLTPEEGTPLHRWIQEGSVAEPDGDLAADMYQWARELLAEAGFHHYEISNWALPGCQARHNVVYWRNLPYLGVGPGAHSRLGDYRFWDISPPRAYMTKVQAWKDGLNDRQKDRQPEPILEFTDATLKTVCQVEGWEHISLETRCAETMILGLRLLDGMNLDEASHQAGADLKSIYAEQISELLGLGLLERHQKVLRVTSSTYMIANQVFTRFVG